MAEKRDGIEYIKKLSELVNGDATSLLENVKKSEGNLKNIKTRLSEKGKMFLDMKKIKEQAEMDAEKASLDNSVRDNKPLNNDNSLDDNKNHNDNNISDNIKASDIKTNEAKVDSVIGSKEKSEIKPINDSKSEIENKTELSAKKNTDINTSLDKKVFETENKKVEVTSSDTVKSSDEKIKTDEEKIIKVQNNDLSKNKPVSKDDMKETDSTKEKKENISQIPQEKKDMSLEAVKNQKSQDQDKNVSAKVEEVKTTSDKIVSDNKPATENKAVAETKPLETKTEESKPVDNKPSWLVRKADKTEEKKPVRRDDNSSNRTPGGYNRTQNPNYVKAPRKEYIASDSNDRNSNYQGRNYNNNYRNNSNGQGGNYQGNNPRPFNNNGPRPYNNNGPRPFNNNGPRPFNNNGQRPFNNASRQASPIAAVPIVAKETKSFGNKKKSNDSSKYEEKKTISKRALIKQSVSIEDFDENKTGYRKLRPVKKAKAKEESQFIKIENAVINTEIIPLKVLSEKIGVSAIELTKKLFKEGIMKTINDSIDFDTAQYIASDLGITLELKVEKTAEEKLSEGFEDETDDESKMVKRPPVVTVMGHVDHGKTSLLDKIRKTSVTAGEAGGITQHIGAYQVSINGRPITFLDTPGHAAFTAMRARGAQATDIAVLVVAADDGIMPQTIEAINHAKSANVPIIVAINKIDKPEANIERIKTQLTEQGLVPEEWGGDVMICPVSAKSGEGIENLLESIILLADLKDLKANPDRKAKGVVIEAKLDQSKGPVATVLIQAGTLKVGDPVIIGTVIGKVRAMVDDKGRKINSAGLSVPVSVMGLDDVPNAGDTLFAVSQQLTKQVAEERKNKAKEDELNSASKVTLDDVFNKIAEGEMKTLNLIVKADVQGSVEAVKQSVSKLGNEEVKVNVIHAAAGAINETDVMLAESSKAIIIGFNVRPDAKAKQSAENGGVDIRLYRVIYEAIDDIEKALKGMLAPKFKETYMGKAEVRNTFKITGVGMVAGCYVVEGKIVRNGKLRIYRDNIMICEGNVLQLKRFKDDVKEVMQGFECGISIEKFNDIKNDDYIECYLVEQVEQ